MNRKVFVLLIFLLLTLGSQGCEDKGEKKTNSDNEGSNEKQNDFILEITDFYPDDDPLYLTEGNGQLFSINITGDNGNVTFEWYLDQVKMDGVGTSYLFSPDHNQSGEHSIKVTISNGEEEEAMTWTVLVQDVNRAPAMLTLSPSENPTIDENTVALFRIETMDPDGDPIEYRWFVDGLKTGNNTSVYEYVTGYGSAGEYVIKCTISDGIETIPFTWDLTVNNVNRPPTDIRFIPENNPIISENDTQEFGVEAVDPDGDPISYSWYLNGNPVQGGTDGSSYVFDSDFSSEGTYEVKVIMSDGSVEISHIWYLFVSQMDLPPTIEEYSPQKDPEIFESENQVFTVNCTDYDSDEILYKWKLDGIELNETGNTYEHTTGYDDAGTYQIEVNITDGQFYVKQNWTLIVKNLNRVPVLSSPQLTPDSGNVTTEFTFKINYSDADNDAPSYVKICLDEAYFDMLATRSETYTEPATYSFTATLEAGIHNYYYYTKDGTEIISFPANGNLHTPDVIPLHGPTLSDGSLTPQTGTASTTEFTYRVTYSDEDNDPPQYINVILDSTNSHDMVKVEPTDNNYVDGVIYQFVTTLNAGTHTYQFKTFDGYAEANLPDSCCPSDGPEVSGRQGAPKIEVTSTESYSTENGEISLVLQSPNDIHLSRYLFDERGESDADAHPDKKLVVLDNPYKNVIISTSKSEK